MEKLAYALWKRDESDQAFADRLLTEVASMLVDLGARGVKVSVVDDAVAAGGGMRISAVEPPKSALVTCWVDQAQERADLEAVLEASATRIAGYLVLESRALFTPHDHLPGPGQRTEGFHLVTGIVPRAGLDHRGFIDYWQQTFRDIAIDCQATWDYVRNEVVRPLTPEAPAWAGIVEEGFPTAALDDSSAFFDAVGDEERLAANQQRLFDSVQEFLDLGQVDSHPMSEYVFEPLP